MFSGIVSLDKNRKIDSQSIIEMKNAFYCDNSLKVKEIVLENAFFLRANTKALTNYSGIYTNNKNTVSLMAGEPLLSKAGIENDHYSIVTALDQDNLNSLKSVRGVFCLARYKNDIMTVLDLCADKLGVRPVYYWTDGCFVVFSTVLRVLEKITLIPKIGNEIALSEIIAFGFPLGNRTKYENIKLLRESEIIRFSLDCVKVFTYWRWDKIKQRNIPLKEATSEAYRVFQEAIKIRLHDDTNVLAFLSGGMDSRAIVGVLIDFGVDVQAFNFSPSNSQDQVFASRFAEKIGCQLNFLPRDNDLPLGFRLQLARLVKELVQEGKMVSSRPHALWSGDGGSVSLGCVYLDEKIVQMFRSGNMLDAIEMYRKKNRHCLPLRAMKSHEKELMSTLLDRVIMKELDLLECSDPGQSLFLFLMYNDQRRHLYDFYEDINFHNLEYQLPFFDSLLLEFVFSLPLDYRLNHQFYTEWFNEFSHSVRDVPWQTYPGHAPCPLSIDRNLGYQWQKKQLSFFEKLKKSHSVGSTGLKIAFFSSSIGPISRYKYLLATTVHLFGIRDYEYLIKAGKIYSDCLNVTKKS